MRVVEQRRLPKCAPHAIVFTIGRKAVPRMCLVDDAVVDDAPGIADELAICCYGAVLRSRPFINPRLQYPKPKCADRRVAESKARQIRMRRIEILEREVE